METKKYRTIRILRELENDLVARWSDIIWNEEILYEQIVKALDARLNREEWNGIYLCGIDEIDEQVKEGLTRGLFGHYEGSKIGGKWWIDENNEVDYKHTTYYDVYDPADYDEPLCDY